MNIEELNKQIKELEEKCSKINFNIRMKTVLRNSKIKHINKILEENNLGFTYDDVQDNIGWFLDYESEPYYRDLLTTINFIQSNESHINKDLLKLKENEEQLKLMQRKLKIDEDKLQKYQNIVPETIENFLNDWKLNVINYFNTKAEEYSKEYPKYIYDKNKLYYECLVKIVNKLIEEDKEAFIEKYCYNDESKFNQMLKIINNEFDSNEDYVLIIVSNFNFKFNDINNPGKSPKYIDFINEWQSKFDDDLFCKWANEKFNKDWLNKEIENDKTDRMISLMARISKITGDIIDSQHLYITDDGNIKGYIIGKDGNAEIESIDAGGYNNPKIFKSTTIKNHHFYIKVVVKSTI